MALIARKAKRRLRRPPARRVIVRKSRKYGVDPRAALAVAAGEGGVKWGGVGDQGTSYGPFQLHRGGALPKGRGARWANSPAGIDYAIRQMAQSGARGKKGHAAIEAIIRRFERPADPDASVRNAKARYGSVKVAKAKRGLKAQGRIVRSASRRPQATPIGTLLPPLREADFSGLQVREQPRYTGRIDMPRIDPHLPALPPPPRAAPAGGWPQGKGMVAPPPRRPGKGFKQTGGWPTAKRGTIIGTPHGGTHTLGNWQSDNALDISVPRGTKLVASRGGRIEGVKIRPEGGRISGSSFYLVLPNGQRIWYTHLSKVNVREGQRVRPGQVIGRTGTASGVPHLHVAVERGDPRAFFAKKVKRKPKRRRKRINI